MIEEGQRIHGKTEVFRVSAGRFIGLLMRRVGWRWLIAPLIAVVVLVVAAIVLTDVRLAILAMMLLFIVVPMIMAMLYVNYGLSETCYVNVVSHEIEFSEKEIVVLTHHVRYSEAVDVEEEIHRHVIDWTSVTAVEYGLKDVLVLISQPRFGFLYVPLDVFKTD